MQLIGGDLVSQCVKQKNKNHFEVGGIKKNNLNTDGFQDIELSVNHAGLSMAFYFDF